MSDYYEAQEDALAERIAEEMENEEDEDAAYERLRELNELRHDESRD